MTLVGGAACAACSGSPAKPSLAANAQPGAVGGSQATITVGTTVYDFVTTCYDAGAGAVVAVGTGVEPGTGRPARALIQTFFNEPYVGVTIGGTAEVLEAAIDRPLELAIDNGVITGNDVEFVRNLELTRGAGEAAGRGSVRVECHGYVQGLPPGYTK
jgi:hypothetical protein